MTDPVVGQRESSEAGGQEREALTWGEYVSRSARYRAAEAEAAHLREALRWIERKARHKDGASLGELSSRLYDIGYHAAFALSQATKREGP